MKPSVINTALFRSYADSDDPVSLELMNHNHEPVAALYLSNMNMDNIVVSETNNAEKYFVYYYGVGIYFTYWRKLPYAK